MNLVATAVIRKQFFSNPQGLIVINLNFSQRALSLVGVNQQHVILSRDHIAARKRHSRLENIVQEIGSPILIATPRDVQAVEISARAVGDNQRGAPLHSVCSRFCRETAKHQDEKDQCS